ncbi:unnamed protein product [Parascedosporium putredinis]|uniref:Photolyase/cryptochrome alpha/beta domain-containing protein n=1 Tax=Parascedosporium putredinis TaxID=1442378 RepID=A0A9P1MD29_9PEZI|nr:unnamed protein product [Parascedosporium putredinis]CAI8001828.1 unnamed protein product [Parascedosporium putredinis]
MSNYRASAYTFGELSRPMEDLDDAIRETQARRDAVAPGRAVVHWFKGDLRTQDNRALYLAGKKAAAARIPLVCLYIVSPQDFEAHLTSPARVDFIFRTLEVLRADLAALDVPLHVETVERRARVPERIAELLKGWGAKHLFANMEYEVDELRRETDLVRLLDGDGVAFTLEHDTCVVAPAA